MGNFVLCFCNLDILAVIVLAAVVVGCTWKYRSLKKIEKDLKKQDA